MSEFRLLQYYGNYAYFKRNNTVYCVSKIKESHKLSYWNGDNWVEAYIEEHVAKALIKDNLVVSIQRAYRWIMESSR